jgi:uncharacterized protein (DUF433 family)
MASRHVLSLALRPEQNERVRRLARRWGRTPSETGARLMEEALRTVEFAGIEFRSAPDGGRRAHLRGHRLPVYWVARLVRQLRGDVAKAAGHFGIPAAAVRAALNYAEAFAEEIDAENHDHDGMGFDALKRQLPQLETARETTEIRRRR